MPAGGYHSILLRFYSIENVCLFVFHSLQFLLMIQLELDPFLSHKKSKNNNSSSRTEQKRIELNWTEGNNTNIDLKHAHMRKRTENTICSSSGANNRAMIPCYVTIYTNTQFKWYLHNHWTFNAFLVTRFFPCQCGRSAKRICCCRVRAREFSLLSVVASSLIQLFATRFTRRYLFTWQLGIKF